MRKGTSLVAERKFTDEEQKLLAEAEKFFKQAGALALQGKLAEALKEFRAALAVSERVLGAKDPEVLSRRHDLAEALNAQGKRDEAEKEYRTIVTIQESALGVEHPDTLNSRSILAARFDIQGKYAEAEKEYRPVVAGRERVLGAEHPDTLMSRHELAKALQAQSKYGEAEKEHRAVLAIHERGLGAKDGHILRTYYYFALCLEAQRKFPEALAFIHRLVNEEQYLFRGDRWILRAGKQVSNRIEAAMKETPAPAQEKPEGKKRLARGTERLIIGSIRHIVAKQLELATNLGNQKMYAEAEQEFRAMIFLLERVLTAESPAFSSRRHFEVDVFVSYNACARCLQEQKKFPEALAFIQQFENRLQKSLGADHPDTKAAKLAREQIAVAMKVAMKAGK